MVLVALLFVGLGALFWWSTETAVVLTNSNSFCTSCHEMEVVTTEYEASSHFSNVTGMVATCADCHVPLALGPALVHKVYALTRHALIVARAACRNIWDCGVIPDRYI